MFQIRETWLHRVNPTFKLGVFLLLYIVIIAIHNLNVMINITAVAFLLLLISGCPFKKLLLIFIPFLFVFISTASAMILYGKGETLWYTFGIINIYEESFYRGLHLGFRALSFGFIGLLFTLTTRPVYLFYSLMQQLKVPPKYAYSFLAGIRLLPIMLEEWRTIRNARLVRGVKVGWNVAEIIGMFIPLLSQSIRRAGRIALAMEAKRFRGDGKRTFYYEVSFSRYDGIFFVILLLMIGTSIQVGVHFPYVSNIDVR